MKTTNFNWGDDVIDSRDIISRYEELNEEYESLEQLSLEAEEELISFFKENGQNVYNDDDQQKEFEELDETFENAKNAVAEFNQSYDKDELDTLTEVINQGENSPDWSYGEPLINENYFTEYIKETIDDCYEMPKEFNEGKWPYNHMTMDWESAAEEAKQDYMEIEVNGLTYYIRA